MFAIRIVRLAAGLVQRQRTIGTQVRILYGLLLMYTCTGTTVVEQLLRLTSIVCGTIVLQLLLLVAVDPLIRIANAERIHVTVALVADLEHDSSGLNDSFRRLLQRLQWLFGGLRWNLVFENCECRRKRQQSIAVSEDRI